VHTFRGLVDSAEHVVLALGPVPPEDGVPLVRVHSECLTGDIFGSRRCDCGPQLDDALAAIGRAGGYLVYLRQEGRGIGLYAKLDAYALQDRGLDTYAANRALGLPEDPRDYEVAAQMLLALGVHEVDLLTGNPDKVASLRAGGVSVRDVRPLPRRATPENLRYLLAKKARGHVFGPEPESSGPRAT
jgi:GTP cyclohydrolase II